MTQLRLASPAVLVLLSVLSACEGDKVLEPTVDGGPDLGESADLGADLLYADAPASIDGPTSALDLAADVPITSIDAPLASEVAQPVADTADAEAETGTIDLGSPGDCMHVEGGPHLGTVTMGAIGAEVRFEVWSSCGALDTGPISASIDHPFIRISTNTCATAVNPSSTAPCTVGLRLTPPAGAAPTTVTAVLAVRSSLGGASISVTGIATTGGGPHTDPSSVNFGILPIGESATRTATFTNVSSQTTAPLSVSLSGAGAAQLFILETTTCKGSLASAASCQIVVQYRPTDRSGVNASVLLTDGAFTVAIPAVGSAIPAVTPSTTYQAAPPSIDFGTVPIGHSSTLTVTVTNMSSPQGPLPVAILSGAGAEQVSIVGPASFGPLAPGASFQIVVRYLPRDTSGVDARIIVTDGQASFGISMVGSAVMPTPLDAAIEAGPDVGGG